MDSAGRHNLFGLGGWIILDNSGVKPEPKDDDTERYGLSRIETLNYVSYTQLVRILKFVNVVVQRLWLNLTNEPKPTPLYFLAVET